MSLENSNILAVIPARGGSKGIPRKNLRTISGITLVEHAFKCIKQLPWVNATVLSTEDDEISQHGINIGIDTPYKRPHELASDDAKSIDAWKHAWLSCEDYFDTTFDISILLEPTSPMRLSKDIENTVQLLIESNANSVATVSRTPGHYTPHKTLQVSNEGYIQSFIKGGLKYSIRQSIPDYYHRNGICYATTRESLIEKDNLIESKCLPLIIDRPVINIDEEYDLKIAEFLMNTSI